MSVLSVFFASPAVLLGLLALPIIWWLLRLTPPRPQRELFPPLRVLASVIKKEETPSKSPWWLTLLRLVIAALIVFALSQPIINPRETQVSENGTLLIVMDNSWSTASDWEDRVTTAGDLIDDAEARDVPVSIVFTADASHNATPDAAARARERLQAAIPRPIHADPVRALSAAVTALENTGVGTLAVLSSGTAPEDTTGAWEDLLALGPEQVRLVEKAELDTVALTSASNQANGFSVAASRIGDTGSNNRFITAHDSQGRPIANGELIFDAGASSATTLLNVPFELRNDFASITIDDGSDAGARYLLDENARRRRVGLISAEPIDLTQQLLSPLYYLTRALAPFADLSVPESEELSAGIAEVLEQRPSVIVMADIGTIPDDVEDRLFEWINQGGLLLRFAGPRIAGGDASDPFVPVDLRRGERALGGALSWSEPQPLAAFAQHGAFAGMSTPDDVTVNRQVLAEPSPDLAAR
ncbi:MAG: BatA domain-containing protein, partial [Pseudomonadota bacterium]